MDSALTHVPASRWQRPGGQFLLGIRQNG